MNDFYRLNGSLKSEYLYIKLTMKIIDKEKENLLMT